MMPYGYIVIERADGATSEILPWTVGVGLFTLLVFITGCAMGVGKAAVYKTSRILRRRTSVPWVGSVGSIGALEASSCPMFAYATAWSGHLRRPSECCSW